MKISKKTKIVGGLLLAFAVAGIATYFITRKNVKNTKDKKKNSKK